MNFNMLMQLKQNPSQILSQRFNIPQGMNDPNAILQHLISTGQVQQSTIDGLMNNAQQLINMFKTS